MFVPVRPVDACGKWTDNYSLPVWRVPSPYDTPQGRLHYYNVMGVLTMTDCIATLALLCACVTSIITMLSLAHFIAWIVGKTFKQVLEWWTTDYPVPFTGLVVFSALWLPVWQAILRHFIH